MTKNNQSEYQELLSQLSSNKKSAVISAIVQLAKVANDEDTVYKLRKLAETADREVSFFATQAIIKIESRMHSQKNETPESQSIQFTLSVTKLIAPLKSEIDVIKNFIRNNRTSISEDLAPAVAVFLGKHGDKEDIPWLVEKLNSFKSNLVLPFIDALENLSSIDLVPHLPNLLASEYPLVRSRAIMALRKIDPDEALAHLSELLASRKVEEKLAGLGIAFFFPFEQVREMILSILQEETDPEVIRGCTTLLISNPDLETAYKLLSIIDTTEKNKSNSLVNVFKTLCSALAAAKVLPPDKANPDSIIANWKRERLSKFLNELEIQLPVASPSKRESIENWLIKNINIPEVLALVEKLAQNPNTEEIAKKILQEYSQQKRLAIFAKVQSVNTEEDQYNLIQALDENSFKSWKDLIIKFATSGSVRVRSAAINAIAKFEPSFENLSIAELAMKEDHPAIVYSAAKFLEKIDSQKLIPYIPKLLSSIDCRLRALGIKIARKYDENKALQSLKEMLFSSDRVTRANAVANMLLFPFEKVSDMLLKALEREDHSSIARQMLVVLLSNPSKELLDKLDRIHARSNYAVSLLIAQARMDLFDLIISLGLDENLTKIETEKTKIEKSHKKKDEIKQNLDSANLSANETEKPYSIENVRNAIRNRQVENIKQAKAIEKKAFLEEWYKHIVISFIIIMLALSPSIILDVIERGRRYAISASDIKQFKIDKENEFAIEPKFVQEQFTMNEVCKIKGKFKEISQEGLVKLAYATMTIWLENVSSVPCLIPNEEVEVEILPYHVYTNGDILAKCIKINNK